MTTTSIAPRRTRLRNPRVRKLLIVGSATALISGGAAFAYWTSTGSGSGTVASTTPGTVVVAQTSVITAVNPGRAAQALSGTITNPAGAASSVYVTSLSVTLASVSKATGAPSGACAVTDYTLTGGTSVAVGQNIDPGASVTWSGPTIAFNNSTTVNQDGCKGATVNLAYTTN